MLPQLPVDLPFATPSMPTSLSGITETLASGSPWAWALAGAALAVISLWAVRRARRMVLAATLGAAGLVVAWNAGFLPLSA